MKTVQIDCILEFSFEGDLTRDELIEKTMKALRNTSYKELGEMLQVDSVDNWHLMNEKGEEED